MKIGVVSDTHSHGLPKKMMEDLQNVDLIVHVGDFCSGEDLKKFREINQVRAVFGNMDGLEIRQLLPEKDIFEAEGLKIGLYHGQGSPEKVLNFVRKEFKKDKLDIVIFGHSHYPFNEVIDDVLYFNPGSPTDVVRPPYCSYGVLEINNGQVSGKIIKIGDENG